MAASSLDSLRDKLRVVLEREDKYLKEYTNMHERIHRIDRSLASPDTQYLARMTMRHVRTKATRRIERARHTVRIQQEKRRELLGRILEMENGTEKADEDAKTLEADKDTIIKEPDEDMKTTAAGKSTKTKKASGKSKEKRNAKQALDKPTS